MFHYALLNVCAKIDALVTISGKTGLKQLYYYIRGGSRISKMHGGS
jgi:hypothetical protein